MAARLIDGKALAQSVREGLAATSAAVLTKTGIRPGLATILVGDDPASHVYVKNKQKACELAGIYVDDHKLSAHTTQAELLALIEKKNADPKILPLREGRVDVQVHYEPYFLRLSALWSFVCSSHATSDRSSSNRLIPTSRIILSGTFSSGV